MGLKTNKNKYVIKYDKQYLVEMESPMAVFIGVKQYKNQSWSK